MTNLRVRMNWRAAAVVASTLVMTLGACGGESRETQLVVGTQLPEELREFVEESFEAGNPSVDVSFIQIDPSAPLAGLRVEGKFPFDVLWGVPGLTLEHAAGEGFLEAHRPPWLDQPGAGEPNASDLWQIVLVTPFVVAFSRERLQLTRAPTDWIDLFHFRWAGEVMPLSPVRSDRGAYFAGAMVVEALREDDDLNRGFDWLDRLDAQVEQYARSSEVIVQSLRTGDALLGILPRAEAEAARADGAPWLHYRLPESGTPMLTLGVAIMEGAEEIEAARTFVDHLGRPEVGTESKLHTRWQPGHGNVDLARFPEGFELDLSWTPLPLAIDTLAAEIDGWTDRWEMEVRGR